MANYTLRFLLMHGLITIFLVGGLGVEDSPELLLESPYLTSSDLFFWGGGEGGVQPISMYTDQTPKHLMNRKNKFEILLLLRLLPA
jgi:hypothetical protein